MVGKNLRENFLEALVHISPSMIGLYKWKTGAIGQWLNKLLQQTKVGLDQSTSPCFFISSLSFLVFPSFFLPFLFSFPCFNSFSSCLCVVICLTITFSRMSSYSFIVYYSQFAAS